MATELAPAKQKETVQPYLPELADGRYELNLCEFPLIVPFSPPADLKSYVIEAPPKWDAMTQQEITRSIEIFPSPGNGFPTTFDAGILRALLTLAHRDNGFTERKVFFTRYEISKLLQLPSGGRTSKRLLQSLQRLSEVRYRVHNIWWDNNTQQRIDFDGFGLLDRVRVVNRTKGRYKEDEERDSFFVFGDKLFESLQSGYVREIDFNISNRFQTHVADQTYLLLKKRFYRQSSVRLSLRTYFQFHLGMCPNYDIGQIKQKLKKGILELEESKLIEAMPYKERFEKDAARGEWKIIFHAKKSAEKISLQQPKQQTELFGAELLVTDLVDRGVTKSIAAKLVKEHDAENIELQIEVFDWKRENKQTLKSPGGWLRKAIKERWNVPDGFVPKATRDKEKAAIAEAKKQQLEAARLEAEQEEKLRVKEATERKAIENYLKGLSESEREACIEEAIGKLKDGFSQQQARKNLRSGSGGIFLHMALAAHILPLVETPSDE